MNDEWSGLADLLATLIEKYLPVVLADDVEVFDVKDTEETADNLCDPLIRSVDNDKVA